MTDNRTTQRSQAGFTLVELSIVLVIIGLIIGGILVSQELIKGAEIRAVVGQYEKFNTATNAFSNKFNGLPGDLLAARATQYGLNALAGTAGLGDGDGIIEGATNTVGGATTSNGESTQFWRHLSQNQLVQGNFDGSQAASVLEVTYPRTRMSAGGWVAFSGTAALQGLGVNFFQIGNPNTAAAAAIATGNVLTPTEAFQIDQKADDGEATSGVIIARGGATLDGNPVFAAANDPTNCINAAWAFNTPAVDYDMSANPANNRNCQLRLKMQ